MGRELVGRQMHQRNDASAAFFGREADRLAEICARMAERFRRGGRLLAFGKGSAASDAQHVAVEFVHPVLVGKRALPALDLSVAYEELLPAIVRSDDIVIGFGTPGDDTVECSLQAAMSRGALTLALPGAAGDYAIDGTAADRFIQQEIIEVLYHTLWETVHVFFEHEALAGHGGRASFLYPFLSDARQATQDVLPEVARSIRSKAAQVERLRVQIADEQSDAMAEVAVAICERVARGGAVLCFGNGGSATDATDLSLDLAAPPKPYAPVPAISLAAEPATLTALANDIGSESIYSRQIIAHGRPQDVAVAISTSGGSANIIEALREARSRGLLTVALLGYDGGEVLRSGLADHALIVRSDQIPRVQEAQASIYHVLVDLLDAVRRDR